MDWSSIRCRTTIFRCQKNWICPNARAMTIKGANAALSSGPPSRRSPGVLRSSPIQQEIAQAPEFLLDDVTEQRVSHRPQLTLDNPPIFFVQRTRHNRKEHFFFHFHMLALGVHKAFGRRDGRLSGQYFVPEDRLDVIAKSAHARVSFPVFAGKISNSVRSGRISCLQLPEHGVFLWMMAAVWIVAEVVCYALEQVVVGISSHSEKSNLVIQQAQQAPNIPMFLKQCLNQRRHCCLLSGPLTSRGRFCVSCSHALREGASGR